MGTGKDGEISHSEDVLQERGRRGEGTEERRGEREKGREGERGGGRRGGIPKNYKSDHKYVCIHACIFSVY